MFYQFVGSGRNAHDSCMYTHTHTHTHTHTRTHTHIYGTKQFLRRYVPLCNWITDCEYNNTCCDDDREFPRWCNCGTVRGFLHHYRGESPSSALFIYRLIPLPYSLLDLFSETEITGKSAKTTSIVYAPVYPRRTITKPISKRRTRTNKQIRCAITV